MSTITIPDRSQSAGIPAQGDDIITAAGSALITGDAPALMTMDVMFAASQTIEPLTPVGPGADKLWVPATDDVGQAAQASGALTFSGVGTAEDTITIGGVTYTLKAAPTTGANEVKIGATADETANNLLAAINGGAGAGTLYGSLTTEHPDVYARKNATAVVGVVAKVGGTAGNAIATTESGTGTSFGAATLTGGTAQIGVKAVGITLVAITTPASPVEGAPVYRAGCFNPDALNWPASFDTDAKKFAAFDGAPTPTNIIMRRPKTATV